MKPFYQKNKLFEDFYNLKFNYAKVLTNAPYHLKRPLLCGAIFGEQIHKILIIFYNENQSQIFYEFILRSYQLNFYQTYSQDNQVQ